MSKIVFCTRVVCSSANTTPPVCSANKANLVSAHSALLRLIQLKLCLVSFARNRMEFIKRGSAPTACAMTPIVLITAPGNFAERQIHNEVRMNKTDGYNSPKGTANNELQKQGQARDSQVTKQAHQPAPKPVTPTINKPTEKGNK